MFSLFKKDDLISIQITKTANVSYQESIIRKNLKIIDRTCPECNFVREARPFDGCAMVTDGKYKYMLSSCDKCGCEWKTKIKKW